MSRTSKFIMFLVFNIIFGLIALIMTIISIVALAKLHQFNAYVLIFAIFKVFILVMSIIAIFSRKKQKLLLFCIISSAINFSIEIIFFILFLSIKGLKQYLIDIINEIKKFDEKDEIPRIVILFLGFDIFFCILSFAFCLVYYKSPEDDIQQGLDEYLNAKNSYTRNNESLTGGINTN